MASFWEAPTQPSLYGYRPNASIRDLILMGGQERAQAAQRSGEIWANTLGNVGQQIGQGIQAYGEQKQQQQKQVAMAKRDAAVSATIQNWNGQDHAKLAADLTHILGPVEGIKMAKDISSFSQSATKEDPKQHLAGTVAGLRVIEGLSDEQMAQNWPQSKPVLQATADKMGLGIQLPDQWDPQLRPMLSTVKSTFEESLGLNKPEEPTGDLIETIDDQGNPIMRRVSPEEAAKGVRKYVPPIKAEKTPEQLRAEAFARGQGEAAGRNSVKPVPEPFDVTADIQTTATGKKFINLSDYKGTNAGESARKAAQAQGAVALSKEDVAVLQEIDAARTNTADITAQIEGKLATSPMGRLEKAGENKLSALFQTDDDLAAYGAWRTAAIKNLRATAGSKGLRLNQAEIELAIQNDIPQLTDTVAVAKKKAQILNTMFDNAENAVFGGRGKAGAPPTPARIIVGHGSLNGRKVIKYSDGTAEYE